MRHGRKATSFVAHGEHDGTLVARPTDERDPNHKPNQSREPTPEAGRNDSADNRSRSGDGLEVVAKENVTVGRHEVHAVHVERRRCGPLGIGLDDIAVNVTGVARLAEVDRENADDHSSQRVHARSPSKLSTVDVIRSDHILLPPVGQGILHRWRSSTAISFSEKNVKDTKWRTLSDEALEGLLVERWVIRGIMPVVMFASAILTTYVGVGEVNTLTDKLQIAALLVVAFTAAAAAFVMRLTRHQDPQRATSSQPALLTDTLSENYRPALLASTVQR